MSEPRGPVRAEPASRRVRSSGTGPKHPDIARSDATPRRESLAIAGLVAFWDPSVDVAIDGVARPRPAR